eukprot:TRINITY_DN11205_c0_g1_i1.p1 TRINITY_DN11205_c0_g1~~TRINITY_DN11205_c0_g1_i1.p1  ORF type:complete len:659 (-),score=173.58 TRINITY_DN11205_c0_g1_i1:62-2038(-)
MESDGETPPGFDSEDAPPGLDSENSTQNNQNNQKKRQRKKKPKPKQHRPKVDQVISNNNSILSTITPHQAHDGPECLTCCEPINYFSIGQCNHKEICSVCSIRMRTLYNDLTCPVCKETLEEVVYTKESNTKFQEFDKSKLDKDDKCNGLFDDDNYHKEVQKLWDLQCPKCTAEPFKTSKELVNHIERTHKLSFCDLCFKFRRVFLHQQVLYTKEELQKHLNGGDPDLRIKPHPLCKFCHQKYFSDEELFKHLTEKHETCFICDMDGVRFQYFRDYSHLEQHFRNKHFLCEDPQCLKDRFVVFKNKMELQAHSVHYHLSSMSRDEQASARRLELSFTVRSTGDRNDRNDRRRNDNTEAPMVIRPDTSSVSLRPEDIGMLKTNSSSSVSTTTTTTTTTTSTTSSPVPGRANTPESESSTLPSKPPTSSEERERRNKELRKNLLSALGNNKQKLETIARLSGDFRKGIISSQKYYQDFFSTLGDRNANTINIFAEVVDLLPASDQEKQNSLRAEHAKYVSKNQPKPRNDQSSSSSSSTNSISSMPNTSTQPSNKTTPKKEAEFPSLPNSAPPPILSSGLGMGNGDWLGRGGRSGGRITQDQFPSLPGSNVTVSSNAVWGGRGRGRGSSPSPSSITNNPWVVLPPPNRGGGGGRGRRGGRS